LTVLHRLQAAIVQYSHDAIFSRTLDGVVTTWNAAAERMFGYRCAEMVGRSSTVLVPRGHRDEFHRLLRRIRSGEVVEHFETVRLRKDGKPIPVSLTLSPIRDETGRCVAFPTVARDMTSQRQVREALERRELELTDLSSRSVIRKACPGYGPR
jgi:PAS domain S-box-containing protein